jgi:hypothetical protein
MFPEGNPRKTGRKSKPLSSADRAFSMTYADPTPFFLLEADSPFKRGDLRIASGRFIDPSVFVSGSSDLIKEVKGWRRFDRGTLGRHLRRPVGRELGCAKGSTSIHGTHPRA